MNTLSIILIVILIVIILFLLLRIRRLKALNKYYWQQWDKFETEAGYFHEKWVKRLPPHELERLQEYVRAGATGYQLYDKFD